MTIISDTYHSHTECFNNCQEKRKSLALCFIDRTNVSPNCILMFKNLTEAQILILRLLIIFNGLLTLSHDRISVFNLCVAQYCPMLFPYCRLSKTFGIENLSFPSLFQTFK